MRRKFRERLSAVQMRAIHHFRLNPPQSIRNFAERIGVAVIEVDLEEGQFGYLDERPDLGSKTGFVIFVEKRLNTFEKRWTVAHELGHYFLHRDRRSGTFDTEIHRGVDRSQYFICEDEEHEAENFAEDLFFDGGALEAFVSMHGFDAHLLASRVFGVPATKVQRAIDFHRRYRGLAIK
jgi:Zn-dependent peptidase ImmA (M78 family)